MSLVIYVSHKTVIISKYNLEFRFSSPPQNLTKAAIGTYQLLRQSEILQTESSRDQKDEVITLLKHYGQALYQSIIPEHIRSQVYKSGGIFIYSLEKEIIDLPWELLFDGSSFFALTQGIIRINKTVSSPAGESSHYMFPSLKLSLNSFIPLEHQQLNWAFSAYIEELATKSVPRSPLIDLEVNGNASPRSILESLEQFPNIFLFTGFESDAGWFLDPTMDTPKKANWLEAELKPKLIQAVKNGLKMVVLQTSYLLEQPKNSCYNPINFVFDCGVPFVLAIHGRLARERLKEYFNVLLLSLIREENIARAHRLAINHIQASLPLSWDWSWIRFHINQKLLESTTEQPLPPFHFDRSLDSRLGMAEKGYHSKDCLHEKRFFGNPEILRQLTERLTSNYSKEILCLNASDGQPIETYLGEWLRRTVPSKSVTLSFFYYQRWGLSAETQSRLPNSKFADLFSFLTASSQLEQHFENSTININTGEKSPADVSLLYVYSPPVRQDVEFDRWLSRMQSSHWKIVFIHDQSYATGLETYDFKLGKTDQVQIISSFEDGLPEQWIELVENNPAAGMGDISLLHIIHQSKNPELIALLKNKPTIEQLYQASFQAILPSLTANRLKLFVNIYLLGISCPLALLKEVLGIKGMDVDLRYLYSSHLIEANLVFDCFWVPVHIRSRIKKLKLIPESILLNQGQELLQMLISCQPENTGYLNFLETGFQYCLMQLVELGELEYPLQRNLQFGKKLSRQYQNRFRHAQNIVTSLELALKVRTGHLIQKTMFSLVEILEELPYENETIAICDWLLEIEKQHRNWSLVSELQTRMASIYAALDKKEKAIGLISSAIKLNNDIKNFSSRYSNLISIAILLLDLGEFDKLSKLLTTANFDMSLLNREDVARLWLIDGHMLYNNKKYREAESSFNKVINHNSLTVSDNLLAKTYLYLADIYDNRGEWNAYVEYLEKALGYLQASGNSDRSIELHEKLYELLISRDDIKGAVKHLEKIFQFYQTSGNKAQIRKAADLLGGLYFKIGEHAKSTELYSIAQGI